MLVSDYAYDLPERLIAQTPAERRDHSRLLVLDRASRSLIDSTFNQLPAFLTAGDLLVLNNTRVFPARLPGRRIRQHANGESIIGRRVEVFLVRRLEPLVWEALVRPGRSLHAGAQIEFEPGHLTAEILEWREAGRRIVRFHAKGDFDEIIDRIGLTPLPPYIKRDERDRLDQERYQTVFARERGAVAAPTAGLHFTPELLDQLKARGIEIAEITLHVGYGTFQPVRVERVEDHRVESEGYTISKDAAQIINRALSEKRRIIAVGTTTTRALESAARQGPGAGGRGPVSFAGNIEPSEERPDETLTPSSSPAPGPRPPAPGTATTDLFIYPGFEFRVLGGLITNFHLPRSSLLMLVAGLAGRKFILEAYRHAVEHEYRFYSYGDAMLIL